MYVFNVTLGTGPTRVIAKDVVVQHPAGFQSVTFQASAATTYVGDENVSATKGILLPTAAPITFTTPIGYTEDLNGWYLFGTGTVTVMVIQ